MEKNSVQELALFPDHHFVSVRQLRGSRSKYFFCETADRTQTLSCTGQVLYHTAIPPLRQILYHVPPRSASRQTCHSSQGFSSESWRFSSPRWPLHPLIHWHAVFMQSFRITRRTESLSNQRWWGKCAREPEWELKTESTPCPLIPPLGRRMKLLNFIKTLSA